MHSIETFAVFLREDKKVRERCRETGCEETETNESQKQTCFKKWNIFYDPIETNNRNSQMFLTTRPSVVAGIFSHQALRVQMSTNVEA